MTTTELLAMLQQAGITLSVTGDMLEIDAPKGGVPEALRSTIREQKTELISALAIPKAVPTDDADLRKRVWRMYPDLVHMTPDKILKRAERWESLRMTREAELARRWMKFKEEQR